MGDSIDYNSLLNLSCLVRYITAWIARWILIQCNTSMLITYYHYYCTVKLLKSNNTAQLKHGTSARNLRSKRTAFTSLVFEKAPSHLHSAHVAERHSEANPIPVERNFPTVKVDTVANYISWTPCLAVHLATNIPLPHALAICTKLQEYRDPFKRLAGMFDLNETSNDIQTGDFYGKITGQGFESKI